jgi:hypothetical protein
MGEKQRCWKGMHRATSPFVAGKYARKRIRQQYQFFSALCVHHFAKFKSQWRTPLDSTNVDLGVACGGGAKAVRHIAKRHGRASLASIGIN